MIFVRNKIRYAKNKYNLYSYEGFSGEFLQYFSYNSFEKGFIKNSVSVRKWVRRNPFYRINSIKYFL